MKITMEAIRHFGHEDPITLAIATLEAQGKVDLAKALLDRCLEEIYPTYEDNTDEVDEEEEDEELDFIIVECGFNPYLGCYDFDE